MINNLQADLQAVCPGLLEITHDASNQWFLNFLVSGESLTQIARLRPSKLLKIPAVGVKTAAIIAGWQKRSHFSNEVEWVGEMIQEDARRCLELDEKVKHLQIKIAALAANSKIAKIFRSVPGFGHVHFRTGRRDWHHRAVQQGRKLGPVLGYGYVGQSIREISRDQGTQASEHAS